MKKHPLVVLVLLAPVIAGCPPQIIPHRSQPSVERVAPLGERRTLKAGEAQTLLRRTSDAPQFEVLADYTPPQHDLFLGGLDYPPLRRGMRFVQTATRSDGIIGVERAGYGVTRPGNFTNRQTYLPVTIWITEAGVVDESMEGKDWTGDALFLPVGATGGPAELSRLDVVLDRTVDGSTAALTLREYDGGAAAPTLERRVNLGAGSRHLLEHDGLALEVVSVTADAVELRLVESKIFFEE